MNNLVENYLSKKVANPIKNVILLWLRGCIGMRIQNHRTFNEVSLYYVLSSTVDVIQSCYINE